jgi:hypothetical protein
MFVQLLKEFLGRKPGDRIDVSESGAHVLVAQHLAQPTGDHWITPAMQKAMEQAFTGFQKGLDAVINTALARFRDLRSAFRQRGRWRGTAEMDEKPRVDTFAGAATILSVVSHRFHVESDASDEPLRLGLLP